MRLFDEDIKREDIEPAKHAEPNFTYLNRTARESFEMIRNIIEDWFINYPESEKKELRARFRSTDDNQHLGAFFELYCYTLLIKLGYSVTIHSSLPNGQLTKPDFLVQYNDQPMFYLEATCAFDSKNETVSNKKVETLIDYIEHINSPNFFIGIEVEKYSKNDIKLSRISSLLERELSMLNPDTITKQHELTGKFSKIILEDNEWIFKFFAIPKSINARDNTQVGNFGMQMKGPTWTDSRKSLLSSLKKKSVKYGELDLPYVIAVNRLGDYVNDIDNIDIFEALFGKEKYIFNTLNEETKFTREPDGLWVGPTGVRNKKVSAVLICSQLIPWTINTVNPIMYHNPWANLTLNNELWRGEQYIPNMSTLKMDKMMGISAKEILGINNVESK